MGKPSHSLQTGCCHLSNLARTCEASCTFRRAGAGAPAAGGARVVYAIGIDVGTTYTSAAICRIDASGAASPESVGLGTRATATASVVHLGDAGRWLFGDAAERRAQETPELVVREFKRRLGDPVPLVVAGQRHKPEAIAAQVVRWVVDRVVEQEGEAPSALTVTHPASWGSYKRSLIAQAIDGVGLSDVSFLCEPVAAAAHYAVQARVDVGATVAVYDLGGGTFDAAVVRKVDEQSFELLGTPQGIDRLGGLDFDQAVFSHLQHSASLPVIDPNDPDGVAAMIRLRRECTEAKEALSADTEATIPVLLPELHTRVRLVRAEFEELIHDAVEETVDALRATIDSAGVALDDIDAVLLVGGSSRIPLVTQLVSQRLARPVVVDADPKAAIALGAAVVAAASLGAAPQPAPAPTPAAARASTVALRRAPHRSRRKVHVRKPEPPAVVAAVPTTPPARRPVSGDGLGTRAPAPSTTRASSAPAYAPRRRRKVSVVALAAALGVAGVGGSVLAVVWPPESDGTRRSVAEAGGAAGTTTTAAVTVAPAPSPASSAVSVPPEVVVAPVVAAVLAPDAPPPLVPAPVDTTAEAGGDRDDDSPAPTGSTRSTTSATSTATSSATSTPSGSNRVPTTTAARGSRGATGSGSASTSPTTTAAVTAPATASSPTPSTAPTPATPPLPTPATTTRPASTSPSGTSPPTSAAAATQPTSPPGTASATDEPAGAAPQAVGAPTALAEPSAPGADSADPLDSP